MISIASALACGASASEAAESSSPATGYPRRTIKFVVPFSPGGAPDVIARILANKLTEQAGVPCIVENRVGANGVIGTDSVARAAPDGYTLLLHGPSFAINPSMYKRLPFDAVADFVPVTEVCATPGTLLVVNPAKTPATSLQGFLKIGQQPDAALAYGSPGIGNAFHLIAEQFLAQSGLKAIHLPFKGAGEVVSALLAGDIQFMFASPPGVAQQIRAGKLRALAFAGKSRSPDFPDVPTLGENGIRDVDLALWYGLFAPKGTPLSVVESIETQTRTVLAKPDVKELLKQQSLDPLGTRHTDFAKLVSDDIATYRRLVQLAGIVPE